MINTGCLVMLLYPAVSDIRCRKFYIEPVIAVCILFILIRAAGEPLTILDAGTGCLPGIFFWGVSRVTKGAVGFGDVIVITCLGMLTGWERVSIICLIALSMAGAVGLGMFILGKANRKTTLPFVPFLLTAYLVEWLYPIFI